MTGAAAIALAAEIAALAPIAGVDFVARRVESVSDALRGGDGVSEREIGEIRLAVARWRSLSPRLRHFYAETAPTSTDARIVLWHLLIDPRPGVLTGPRTGSLYRSWRDLYGSDPAIDLYPRTLTGGTPNE
jgi:hypothetical protein